MKKLIFLLFLLNISLTFCNTKIYNEENYKFPFKNRFTSTAIGTPPRLQYKIKKKPVVSLYKLQINKTNNIPEIFWFAKKNIFSLAKQKKKAPLVYIFSGTGGYYNAPKTKFLRDVFYNNGFHVVSLTSPSHPSFLINSSSYGYTGIIEKDSKDLYKVMKKAHEIIKKQIKYTDIYLVSYSLGGTHAAFVSKLDDKEHYFNFKKIFIINPAVNLYTSSIILDDLVEKYFPNKISDVNNFISNTENLFFNIYPHDHINLDLNIIKDNSYNLEGLGLTEEKFKIFIGLSFRNSITNISFISDIKNNLGKIVPKDTKLSKFDSITKYYKKANNMSYIKYFNEYVLENLKKDDPTLTKEKLIDMANMMSITDYLKNKKNMYVAINEDESILLPEEVKWLKDTFKGRSFIYPYGGHCGNMYYKQNVDDMLSFILDKKN
ncbi:hypothetical protein EV215_2038 [Hypnocyclicus thermotrophus]|uniref:Serine aminopeptidase S33 family n=1 Tax=Hypnocyclicus thermotrophus TaxID=1627895 RepID=A0AA46I4T0_9FUSO|nr:hypothetical protein [Hypnocyclicus thermotrophus]TDT67360.1 hypothetical protein EV215_2038 [Hypnocyclicus thermotrophus]